MRDILNVTSEEDVKAPTCLFGGFYEAEQEISKARYLKENRNFVKDRHQRVYAEL